MIYTATAVGDIIMAGGFKGPAAPCNAVRALLRGGYHCFANLELPLTDATEQADKVICLKAPPALAADLRALGIDVATFANNHALDFGVTGLRDTLAALERAGIATVGAGLSLAESLKPAILTTAGARAAFIGVATTLPNGSGAGTRRPGVAPIRVTTRHVVDPVTIQECPGMSPYVETVMEAGDVDRVLEAVRKAAAQSDVVIVGIHWGVPYGFVAQTQDELADYQRPLGRALIDSGASAVIGHHPHYLQGIEFHRNRPILYSLGNFVIHDMIPQGPGEDRAYPPYRFDSITSDLTRIGAIARLTWTDPNLPPACVLSLIALDDHGEPVIAGQDVASRAHALIERSSRRLGSHAVLRLNGDRPEITVTAG